MKYFKDKNNNVYGYDSDGSQDEYIKEGLIQITEKEVDELTKPKIEQIEEDNKLIITELTQEATGKIDILEDSISLGMNEKGDEDKLKEWKKYRVLLTRVDTSVEEMELPEKPE